MVDAKNAQLEEMLRLLGRLLRLPVVAVVTGQRQAQRIVTLGLKPERAHELSGLASLVPSCGVVSVSDLSAVSGWAQTPITNDGLRFLAGTSVKRPSGTRLVLLALDSSSRPPLTYTERIVIEEFSAVLSALLELEPERDDVPLEYGHSRRPDAVFSSQSSSEVAPREAVIEDVKQQAINDERLRIARELHDGIGKDVFGLAMLLESVAETQKGRAVQHDLLKCAQIARALGNDARALLGALREPTSVSLEQALNAIIASFQTDGLRVHLNLREPAPELFQAATHELGRIVQEALENVRRHAEAENAWVNIKIEGATLVLCVEDDGKGIQGPPPPNRYGLTGMRERIGLLGGHLMIQSSPRGGTRIEARAPLVNLKDSHVNRT
jgi:signal transduction histidine kinase